MNKLAKFIELDLDKPRKLLYNLNAMAAYEKESGKNFLDLPSETVSATLLRIILWSGLIHEDKKLTIEQVGDMINAENMLAIQGKVAQAASANSPEASEGTVPLEQKPGHPA